MSKKVLFDCDTGGDDACAVALAVASPEPEIEEDGEENAEA